MKVLSCIGIVAVVCASAGCKKEKKAAVAVDGGTVAAPATGGDGGAAGGMGVRSALPEGKMGAPGEGAMEGVVPEARMPPSDAEPNCRNAVERMISMMEAGPGAGPTPPEERAKMIADAIESCEKDKTPPESLKCVLRAETLTALGVCAAERAAKRPPPSPEVKARCVGLAKHVIGIIAPAAGKTPDAEGEAAMIKGCTDNPPDEAEGKCILAAKTMDDLGKCKP